MNKPKSIGTKFETAVCRYMQGALQDLRIERRALHGNKDMGDLFGIYAHGNTGIAECKAVKQYGDKLLSEWKEQAIDERENADADFALLVVKQPYKNVSQSLVFVTIRDLTSICIGIAPASTCGLYDDVWISMTLETACWLMRGV